MDGPTTAVFDTLHVEHSSTVDRVAGELRRAVFDGELESGTPLRELALASSLGVSRPTVREALTLLVSEGLATREPHRGVAVASPQAESVRDVCRARLVLEGAGVRRWPDAAEELRERVRSALAAYTTSVADRVSYQELNERHLAFHVSLVGLTGSPRLVVMAEALVSELRLALAQVDRLRRNAHDQADTHTALVLLLESCDPDGTGDPGCTDPAYAFLEAHLAYAEVAILEALALEST